MIKKILPNWETDIQALQNFAKIRLIAMDLDGTSLESHDSHIWKTLPKLMRSLTHHRYQVMVTLSTGRTLFGISKLLKELSLPKGIPLILYNGSLVIENTTFKMLFQRSIESEHLYYILDLVRDFNIDILAYIYKSTSGTLIDTESEREYVLGWSKTPRSMCEFNGMPVRWQNGNTIKHPSPTAILIDTCKDPKCISRIEEKLRKYTKVSFTCSGASYIEIRPRNSNKGAALEYVAQAQNLSKEEVLAIGDNDNDSEMLVWAGIGVAISNASETALANSDYVCRRGVAEGAIEVLRIVKEARRFFFKPNTKRARK